MAKKKPKIKVDLKPSDKKVTIKVEPTPSYKIPKGHTPRRNGAGPHKDKRTKRDRSRADNKRNAVEDQEK